MASNQDNPHLREMREHLGDAIQAKIEDAFNAPNPFEQFVGYMRFQGTPCPFQSSFTTVSVQPRTVRTIEAKITQVR